jgi:hypothetical protein
MGKHESSIAQNTVELLHTAVPGPRRLKDRRRHKRRRALSMKLTFLGADHEAFNWSVGGFLVKDTHPETPVGTTTEGFLTVVGSPGRFAVMIELVRRDKRQGEIAWRFIDPSQGLLNTLTRLGE